MKKNLIKYLIAVCAIALLSGCSSSGGTKDSGSAQVEDRSISSDEMSEIDSRATSSGLDEDGGFIGDPLDDPNSLLATRIIYFEYDSSNVREDFRSAIEEHARYLAENPSASMVLEGHADERGSREYNLALSERRALSVRRQLVLLGASAEQVRAVSYGEERPAVDGHDESAYALNRRVEIIY
ncbi:MAG: peptidoglycan-associated lipoprotein Pal [Gammaproteobacteria bacterium]